MKIVVLIVRLLLELVFFVFSLNAFLPGAAPFAFKGADFPLRLGTKPSDNENRAFMPDTSRTRFPISRSSCSDGRGSGRLRNSGPENFLGALSNSGPAVRLYSEGRAPGHQIKENPKGLGGTQS